jgi:PAS domain-containing protein
MPQRLSEMSDMVAAVIDAIPSPIFVVDDDVVILGYNQAAAQMLAQAPELVIRRRAGELLHCVHASETPEGCGRAEFCKDCPVRISVTAAISGSRVVRRRARMELLQEGHTEPIYLLVTTAPFSHQGKSLALLILEDISELMELKNLLPICTQCKRIRNDQDYWQSLEAYFREHLDLGFSHSICPECAQKFYPEFMQDKK